MEPATASIANTDCTKACITCGIDVSPKWWPCPLTSDETTDITVGFASNPLRLANSPQLLNSIEAVLHADQALANGQAPQQVIEGVNGHAALAAAALNENNQHVSATSRDVRCHKCHLEKARKVATPPAQPPASIMQEEVLRPQVIALTPLATSPDMPSPAPVPMVAQYAWPNSSYSSDTSYNDWARPSSSAQNGSLMHQYSDNRSTHNVGPAIQQPNGQSQIRQSGVGPSQSPHQNGHMAQRLTNGYAHHSMSGPPAHMHHTAYGAYASTRPAPQHLTNGGPPPRAPESPFIQNGHPHLHHRSSFNVPHASPPVPRELLSTVREPNGQQINGARPVDGRVNGGASASPSLRNLLS